MEGLLILALIVGMVVCWIWLRERMNEMDLRWQTLDRRMTSFGYRLDALELRLPRAAAQRQAEAPAAPPAAAPGFIDRPGDVEHPAPIPPAPTLRRSEGTAPPVTAPPVPQAERPSTPPVAPPRQAERPAAPPSALSVPEAEAPAAPVTAASIPQTERPTPPAAAPGFTDRLGEAQAPARPPRDWEATLGGNWLNKAGVVLLVIGLALALGYSFAHIGPAGRVAVSLAVSFAMLAAGALFEPRPRYRIFARGLLGGGWAALYTTVYAMHAVREARVVESPVAGALLLFAVAAGMIVHSLKYREESVTGPAYFTAFFTLAITQVNWFAVLALIPLAASMLYLAHRFAWWKMALFGLIATYGTCALRGDTGAPLWQAQAVFATFWLLFEIFDVLHLETWLLPLNAAGFLGLSLLKWHNAAPHDVWMLLGATAAAYLASALARARSALWHGAATLAAALAAAAIFQKLDHQWIASALVVEAELVYLAGLRLGKPYLRWLGTSLFAIELGRLLLFDVNTLPLAAWVPVASLDVAAFYTNRALCAADIFYGYAAAFVGAVIAGAEANDQTRGLAWFLSGATPFLLGWWRRLPDFRIQGYALALLGMAGIATATPQPVLALGVVAALSYAARFGMARLPEDEANIARYAAEIAAVAAVATLIWRCVPGEYLGIAWMAAAGAMAELGLPEAQVLAAVGVVRVLYFNAAQATNYGPWIPRAIPAVAAAMAYLAGWRRRTILGAAASVGTLFLAVALWALLPEVLVGPAWALLAVALAEFDIPVLRWQAHAVSAAVLARMFYSNFTEANRLPAVTFVLLSHYYLWWRARR
ncbi:MAG TPA: DUF2339 domain-containing protein, partial [Candidatus Sulfopaludibacter sp.]|nr:DUF2339 domain-containing protein [Candidatus Sulfopaludibacter sp.]